MADEATTVNASTGDSVSDNPELAKLEQAVNDQAASQDSPQTDVLEQSADDAPQEGQAFQRLAEKKGFKNVDDLVQAYENMESMGTQTAQQLNEMRKEIRSIKETPQTQDDPMSSLPPEQKEALELLGKVIDERLDSRLQPLKQDLEVRSAQQEIEKIKGQFPGINDVQLEQAVSVVSKHPSLSLDEAVKLVTYEQAAVAGRAKAQKTEKTEQGKRAFVESAKGSKTGTDIDYTKLSLEELENILPKNGQFIDSKGSLRK